MLLVRLLELVLLRLAIWQLLILGAGVKQAAAAAVVTSALQTVLWMLRLRLLLLLLRRGVQGQKTGRGGLSGQRWQRGKLVQLLILGLRPLFALRHWRLLLLLVLLLLAVGRR